MSEINVVTLIGRVTRDSELKKLPSGVSKCEFSIAVNRRVKKNEQWEDVASFFDLALFDKRADNLVNYLKKGTQVGVFGSLEQERWEDKEGKKHSKIVVKIQDLQLLGGRPSGGQSAPSDPTGDAPYDENNIPF